MKDVCLCNHLFRRGAVYYYRRRIPTDLLEDYPGKNEFCFSLKTKAPREAKERARIEDIRLDQEFAQVRRRKENASQVRQLTSVVGAQAPVNGADSPNPASQGATLTELDIERLALLYRHEALKQDELDRQSIPAPDSPQAIQVVREWQEHNDNMRQLHARAGQEYTPEPFNEAALRAKTLEAKRVHAELFVNMAGPALANGDTSLMGDIPDKFIVAQNLSIPTDSESYRALRFAFLKQELDIQTIIQQRLEGNWIDTPPAYVARPHSSNAPEAQRLALANTPSEDNPLFSLVCEEYFRIRKPAKGTEKQFRTSLARFISLVGDLPVKSITAAHMRQFRDAVQGIPTRLPKHVNGGSIPDILQYVRVEQTKGRTLPTLSSNTINDGLLASVKTVLSYAVANGYLENSPAAQIRAAWQDNDNSPGRGFYTTEDLNAIFSSSFFDPAVKAKHMSEDRRLDYQWMMLTALFTGARAEELGQLYLSDIREEDGIAYLFIHADPSTGRRLKTKSSRRKIPIHPRLLELGFIEFVQLRRQQNQTRLFAFLRYSESAAKYTHAFGHWYGRFLASIGIKTPQKVFHSFRHTFKRAMRDAGVDSALTDALQGHANDQGVSGQYGLDAEGMGYSMPVLFEAVSKTKFEGVQFTRNK